MIGSIVRPCGCYTVERPDGWIEHYACADHLPAAPIYPWDKRVVSEVDGRGWSERVKGFESSFWSSVRSLYRRWIARMN